jgi:hypothetical protein
MVRERGLPWVMLTGHRGDVKPAGVPLAANARQEEESGSRLNCPATVRQLSAFAEGLNILLL